MIKIICWLENIIFVWFLVFKVQQLHTQCDNIASMSYKQEESRLSKTVVEFINNKYMCKSNSTKVASKNNIKINIPHR